MEITYVQFIHDVAIGGDVSSISSWSDDRYGEFIRCHEKSGFIVLTCKDGSVRRVPMANVTYIREREGGKK